MITTGSIPAALPGGKASLSGAHIYTSGVPDNKPKKEHNHAWSVSDKLAHKPSTNTCAFK